MINKVHKYVRIFLQREHPTPSHITTSRAGLLRYISTAATYSIVIGMVMWEGVACSTKAVIKSLLVCALCLATTTILATLLFL